MRFTLLVVVSLAVVGCGASAKDDPALSRLPEGSTVVLFDRHKTRIPVNQYIDLNEPSEDRRPRRSLPIGTKLFVVEDKGKLDDPDRTVEVLWRDGPGAEAELPWLPKRSQLRPAR